MFCHGVCEPNDCSCGQAAASACNARTQQARQPSRASLPACGGLQLKRKVEFRPSVSARITYPYRSYITTYIPKSHSRLGTGGVSASPAQNRGFGPPRPVFCPTWSIIQDAARGQTWSIIHISNPKGRFSRFCDLHFAVVVVVHTTQRRCPVC
jgi:hypothetical protein